MKLKGETTILYVVQFSISEQRSPNVKFEVERRCTLYTANGPSARTVCIKQSIGFLYSFPPALDNTFTEPDPGAGPSVGCPR